MKTSRLLTLGSSLCGLALLTASCVSSGAEPGSVEVFTWWGEPGETDAMQKVTALFDGMHPGGPIRDTAAGNSSDARTRLSERMIARFPPDTFQANGGWDLFTWVLYSGKDDSDSKMEPLDDFARSEGWKAVFASPALDTVKYKGTMYAVPINVHRVNTLFFNKRVFDQAHVRPPTRDDGLDQLFALADQLSAQGIPPFAVVIDEPWTLSLTLFENLLVARAGPLYYRDFFCGNGDALDVKIEAAVKDLGRVLSLSYKAKNAAAGKAKWTDAVEQVRSGNAAMTITGDWAKGYFLARETAPADYGEIPMPGTNGTFVFTTDTFGLPKGAPNRSGALELLRLFASKQGQEIFNPTKGSTSPRKDIAREVYDPMAQETFDDFWSATQDESRLVRATALMARPDFMDPVFRALHDFAASTDLDVVGNTSIVIYTLRNWYDMLKLQPSLCSLASP